MIGRDPLDILLGKPVVTYAKQGDSYHNWGLAVDIIFTRYGYLSDGSSAEYNGKSYKYAQLADLYEDTGLVAWAKSLGLRWLGRDVKLQDVAHFEYGSLPAKEYRKEEYAVSGWWDNKELGRGTIDKIAEGVGSFFDRAFWVSALIAGVYFYNKSRK